MLEEGLQGVKFFEFLTEEEREEFLEGSELATFEVGEEIIEEGGETHDLFVLTSGRVEVRKSISGSRDLPALYSSNCRKERSRKPTQPRSNTYGAPGVSLAHRTGAERLRTAPRGGTMGA